MTHKETCKIIHLLFSKLQRNVEITVIFCMHIRKDRTDNKDMLKKEMNNVELFRTVLDVAIVCINLSFKNIQLLLVQGWI